MDIFFLKSVHTFALEFEVFFAPGTSLVKNNAPILWWFDSCFTQSKGVFRLLWPTAGPPADSARDFLPASDEEFDGGQVALELLVVPVVEAAGVVEPCDDGVDALRVFALPLLVQRGGAQVECLTSAKGSRNTLDHFGGCFLLAYCKAPKHLHRNRNT